jgi:hypothetical protein
MKTTSVLVATLVVALLMLFADRVASGQSGSPQSAAERQNRAVAGTVVVANSTLRPENTSIVSPPPTSPQSQSRKPEVLKTDGIKPETQPGLSSPARDLLKNELRYEGKWVTTKNKKLDGTISCLVKPQGQDRWQGRFWGVWQQVPFDYTVEFTAMKSEQELWLAAGNPRAATATATDGNATSKSPTQSELTASEPPAGSSTSKVSPEIRAALKPALMKPAAGVPSVGKPIENLVQGIATIDGANYQWIGNMTPSDFTIQFTGSRYDGHIEMKRVAEERKD